MISYIVRRLIHAFVIVLLVSFVVFFLIRMLPGDPIDMLLSSQQQQEYTPEQIDAIREARGLNRPIIVQYLDWFTQMLGGNFGNSLMRNFDIGQEMGNRVVVSLMIGLTAFVIGFVVGPVLGVISAIRRGKFLDNLVTTLANIGITAPSFWVAILLMYYISFRLGLLPLYGYTLPWVDLSMNIQQSILPVFVTALGPIGSSCRQMRSSVLEVMNEDYIRTAWAKGLNERKVILKHIIKNALMPVVTLQGMMLRMIIGGSVVVETIFVVPGMGRMMVDGMLSQDYTVVQAVTVVMTIVVVLSSLLVDLLYGWIDPRIQYS